MNLIPGYTQTISKNKDRFPFLPNNFNVTGFGQNSSYIYINNESYIDMTASLGSIILGYNQAQIDRHQMLPVPTQSEKELAELLNKKISYAENIRFFKNGSDATSAAIRLARAVSGENIVLKCGYHGWHDWCSDDIGIPIQVQNLTFNFNYGDIDDLKIKIKKFRPACVIMETINRACPEKASKEYLQQVRELCTENNVILIFDEILMGFRCHIAGGGGYFGIEPDLGCYSKAMSNGLPLSALVGKEKYMYKLADMKISGTYFCDDFSIQEAIKTINFIENENVIEKISHTGNVFTFQIRHIIDSFYLNDRVYIKEFGPWNSLVWANKHDELLFLKHLTKRKVLYSRDNFIMYSHKREILDKVTNIYIDCFDEAF